MAEKFKHLTESLPSAVIPEKSSKKEQQGQVLAEEVRREKQGDKTLEIEKFLDEVDFLLLRELFGDVAKRCGISDEKLNFQNREGIIVDEGLPYLGYWRAEKNIISLGIGNYFPRLTTPEQKNEFKAEIERYGGKKLKQLATLVHEETHAVSRNTCIWGDFKLPDGTSMPDLHYRQSGFSRTINREDIYKSRFNDPAFKALNEGVVEKLSREIMVAYLKRSGWPKDQTSTYETSIAKNEGMSYSLDVSLVNAIVKKLASKNQQSEQICWNGLVHALLNGETFEEQEMVELFEESFGPSFLTDLSDLHSSSSGAYNDYNERIKRFKMKHSL